MVYRQFAFAILFSSSILTQSSPSGASEIPFKFRDGLIWIQVTAPQSADRLNFLVDSGANVSVVDLRVAKRLKMKLGRLVDVRAVNGQSEGYWPVRMSARTGVVLLPENYLAVDLVRLSQSCMCSVDGLLGADFFKDRVVQIDFASETIRLLEQTVPAVPSAILPLEFRRGVLQVSVQVNEAPPQWLRLDTGCASPLEWVTSGEPSRTGLFKISIGLAETRIPQARMSVRLGRETHEVMAGVHERELFPSERGLLGNGLLARFARVTVHAKGHRLILEPTAP